jgi:hypothetical protein
VLPQVRKILARKGATECTKRPSKSNFLWPQRVLLAVNPVKRLPRTIFGWPWRVLLLIPLAFHALNIIAFVVQFKLAVKRNAVPEMDQLWEIGQWGQWVIAGLVGFLAACAKRFWDFDSRGKNPLGWIIDSDVDLDNNVQGSGGYDLVQDGVQLQLLSSDLGRFEVHGIADQV